MNIALIDQLVKEYKDNCHKSDLPESLYRQMETLEKPELHLFLNRILGKIDFELIESLVKKFEKNPNSWPDLWVRGEGLNDNEKKLFTEMCMLSEKYPKPSENNSVNVKEFTQFYTSVLAKPFNKKIDMYKELLKQKFNIFTWVKLVWVKISLFYLKVNLKIGDFLIIYG